MSKDKDSVNVAFNATYDYDAFGNLTENTGSEATNNPFRYNGQYTDDETGLLYLRNRYYDPTTGRFTQEDPIKDKLNWYVYCGNNPVNFADPLGLKPVMLYYAIKRCGGSVSYNEETGTATVYFDGQSREYTGEIINGRMIVDSSVLAKDFNIAESYLLHNEEDKFESADDAAMAFGLSYNLTSCLPNGVEYQAYIYRNPDGTYTFSDVYEGIDLGNGYRTVLASDPDVNRDFDSWAHTHGAYPDPENPDTALDLFTGRNEVVDEYGDVMFLGDGAYSKALNADGYVFTPGGNFKHLDKDKWIEKNETWINDTNPAVRVISNSFPTSL